MTTHEATVAGLTAELRLTNRFVILRHVKGGYVVVDADHADRPVSRVVTTLVAAKGWQYGEYESWARRWLAGR